MSSNIRTIRPAERRPRRRITIELEADDADAIEAALEAQPVRPSRTELIRTALRRGLRGMQGRDGGPGLAVRCD